MKHSSALERANGRLELFVLFEKYLYFWKWFLLSFLISAALGFIYYRYSDKIYFTQAMILLQDEKQASGDMAGLGELAMLAGRTSSSAAYVNDQTHVLNSRRIMRKVVEVNRLHVSYFVQGKLKAKQITERESPFKLLLREPNHPRLDSMRTDFIITRKAGELTIAEMLQEPVRIKPGDIYSSTLGPISVLPQDSDNDDLIIKITVVPREMMTNILRSQMDIQSNSKEQSFAVNIAMHSTSPTMGALVVNSLIEQYNQDVSLDKMQKFKSTAAFINSRLELIAKDLQSADAGVANFKESADITDLQREAEAFMQNASEYDKRWVEKQTQYSIAKLLQNELKNKEKELLPSNIGLADPSIASHVHAYNNTFLELEDLKKSAKPEHPLVLNFDRNLEAMRISLEDALSNYVKHLELDIQALGAQRHKFQKKLTQIPKQEKGFNSIFRQQKVVEAIYLFLLQKREENEINASAKTANIKIVDDAYTYGKPVSPKRLYIAIAVVFLGLGVPFGILYLKFLLDNKVHARDDLIALVGAPILVEVPTSTEKIIADNSRSSLGEALRILRTNMLYMLDQRTDKGKVIYATSTISGEGKSFIATNLAKIINLSEKRVLLIGADIRSPKVLDYLGLSHLQYTHKGITQYLVDPTLNIDEIIIKSPEPYAFDIVYAGHVAPNPAELLMRGYFADIIEYGREHYDYVIVDTAPVSLVTDTLLIAQHADLTIFVVRAEYLDRRQLVVAKDLYTEGKLKNMALVLNDVNFQKGYGYGYGYGEAEGSRKKSWFNRRFMFNSKST